MVLVVLYDFSDWDMELKYMYLDRSRYGATLQTKPKYRNDSEKYCKVSKKDLTSVDSIGELCEKMFSH